MPIAVEKMDGRAIAVEAKGRSQKSTQGCDRFLYSLAFDEYVAAKAWVQPQAIEGYF